MAGDLLGDTFDIHGGGMDLKFPHHENEIAQSEAATGKPFVRTWLHTGFLTVRGEKMSKSLGNFVTVGDALERWEPEVLRALFVQTHYRSRIDYSEAALVQARIHTERIRTMLELLEEAKAKGAKEAPDEPALLEQVRAAREGFDRAMDNDFDTPGAWARIVEMVGILNRMAAKPCSVPGLERAELDFRTCADLLGVVPGRKAAQAAGSEQGLLDLLVKVRAEARKAKAYAISDQVRDGLAALGYAIEDTADGAKVRRK
jgi:cysteinyl-tRNA synthetase